MRPLTAAALDALVVAAFVVLGRRSHAEGLDPAGLVATAWPFLVALVLGWAAARAWRQPTSLVPVGLVVSAATVAGGLGLRRATGGGTEPSFVVVTAVVLGAGLLGWRAVVRRRARRSAEAGGPAGVRGTARSR